MESDKHQRRTEHDWVSIGLYMAMSAISLVAFALVLQFAVTELPPLAFGPAIFISAMVLIVPVHWWGLNNA